jgi:glycosyltransferase involved in cell wall biosynthesis
MAAGEVVAFLDDDAVPEPRWLADLVAGYDHCDVGGVGGAVYDYTGRRYQFRNGICNRLGEARLNIDEPLWAYQIPGADPFATLIGANSSFRKSCLLEIGGFDEEIEYYLDETDICVRLIDRGWLIRSVERGLVHHHYQRNHLRDARRVIHHPYPLIKNKLYFSLTHGRDRYSMAQILAETCRLADAFLAEIAPSLGREAHRTFVREVEDGLEDGRTRGIRGERKSGSFRTVECAVREFLPYPVRRPAGRKLCICLVSQELPPRKYGGIGRFTQDMASGLAEIGHEVHVVTAADDHEETEYENGVWIHRVMEDGSARPELAPWPTARRNLSRATAVHREIERIAEGRQIDVIQAPIWDCEGVLCQLDPRWRTVLSLQTSASIAARLNPEWGASPCGQGSIALEQFAVRTASYVHTISDDILRRVQDDHPVRFDAAHVGMVPLGIPDRSKRYSRTTGRGSVRVLFVGRLEKRKGIDHFLVAATRLARLRENVDFLVVGDDQLPAEDGRTHRQRFESSTDPNILKRFHFTGRVAEEDLYHYYVQSDIFCAPSRYESFGLVFLEAMMFGLPVIGCDVGGMKEVIDPGVNGFLVEPGSAAALAHGMLALVDDEEMRLEMGAKSRARFLDRYTAQAMCNGIESYYQRIVRT